ncbi:MAG: adenylate kinase [Sedimentisphaerales bacterium]|nr:adenylate kinase [Sedimentisphaerales bacterium]
MRIIILGAPGAGKGTQCKRVVEKYGLQHLSSGDILRKNRAGGTELGKKAQSYMDSGKLVPDDLIVEMMATAISQSPDTGFVLDGFPRTVNQAEELDKALEADGKKIDAIINLKIEDDVILGRMTGRRSCPKCGAVYHIKNLKPKADGKCDKDGTGLIQRPDDTPEVVKQRLETYYEQTEPVVGYYKNNGCVIVLDAGKSADAISSELFETLDALAGN